MLRNFDRYFKMALRNAGCSPFAWMTAGALTIVGCSRGDDNTAVDSESGAPTVYTTSYPLQYFGSRIGEPEVRVLCPVPKNVKPHAWLPSPKTIRRYQRADLLLVNGSGLEGWVRRTSLPYSKIVDTTSQLSDRLLEYKADVAHRHGTDGTHSHAGKNPYVWIDPDLARQQCDAIYGSFASAWPEHQSLFQKRYRMLSRELKDLDASLQRLFQQLSGRPLVLTHPAYRYLVSAYDWEGPVIDIDLEAIGRKAARGRLKKRLDRKTRGLMLSETALEEAFVKRLNGKLGIATVFFSLGQHAPPGTNDYLTVMRDNCKRLRERAGQGSQSPQ